MSDELLKRLETGHDKECAMSYGMHEHCCDCSYPTRQEAAARVRELEAAYAAKMKETVYVANERDALRAENERLRGLLLRCYNDEGLQRPMPDDVIAALAGGE